MKIQHSKISKTDSEVRNISSEGKKEKLTQVEKEKLIKLLEVRFEKNMNRHKRHSWTKVLEKLKAKDTSLQTLNQMEQTGGEPDVVDVDPKTDVYLFIDCSEESPKGRRSLCYDRVALDSRKEFKPRDSAMDLAAAMGIELLSEEQYRKLQKFGVFDTKTSSWLKTPESIRILGGAIFADRRYDAVFVFHNGADSYYGSRGFRGVLRI